MEWIKMKKNKQRHIRLQGFAFGEIRAKLTLLRVYCNKNNHYKGIYKDKENPEVTYSHWLTDYEIQKIKQDDSVRIIYTK